MSIPGQIPAGNRLKREFYLINQIPPGQDGERQDMNKDGFILALGRDKTGDLQGVFENLS